MRGMMDMTGAMGMTGTTGIMNAIGGAGSIARMSGGSLRRTGMGRMGLALESMSVVVTGLMGKRNTTRQG